MKSQFTTKSFLILTMFMSLVSCINQPDMLPSVGTDTPTPTIMVTSTATLISASDTFVSTSTETNLPSSTSISIVLGETTKNFVWLRAGPGENYHAVATYGSKVIVTVRGKSEDGKWLLILMPDGNEGWIPSNSVQTNSSTVDVSVAAAPPTETLQPTLPPGVKIVRPPGTHYPTGDLNHDCVVNSADSAIVQSHYGETGGASDLNGDGIVNIVDVGIVTDHMGQTC